MESQLHSPLEPRILFQQIQVEILRVSVEIVLKERKGGEKNEKRKKKIYSELRS